MTSPAKAIGLALVALWAVITGAWIWTTHFDSALDPVPNAGMPLSTEGVRASAGADRRQGLSSRGVDRVAPVPIATDVNASPISARPAPAPQPATVSPPAAPPPSQPIVDPFSSKSHPSFAAAPGPEQIDHEREDMLEAELAADPQAFATKYGVTPERIRAAQSANLPLRIMLDMQTQKQSGVKP